MKNVFLGSSSKAIPVAKKLAEYLRQELGTGADIREWYDPAQFPPSQTTLEGLVKQAENCDFAVMLLTKDDFTEKKGQKLDLPRDNTIFELGLFMGELGRERCFMVCGAEKDALPSDVAGYTYIPIKLDDVTTDAGYRQAVLNGPGPRVRDAIQDCDCAEHRGLPLITKQRLSEFERPLKEKGKLIASTAVVVNSVEPVEQNDLQFCLTILKNLKFGVQYEYYFGKFEDNRGPAALLVLNIATAEWQIQGASIKDNLPALKRNLEVMQRNLSIHFRRRPPLQFCIHNAQSEEYATCYLRCQRDEFGDRFASWARKRAAKDIANDLRRSCTVKDRGVSIFHATIDESLDKSRLRSDIRDAFGSELPEEFLKELELRCIGA